MPKHVFLQDVTCTTVQQLGATFTGNLAQASKRALDFGRPSTGLFLFPLLPVRTLVRIYIYTHPSILTYLIVSYSML